MARVTNLFKDKVYVFSSLREVFSSEEELIANIFHKEGMQAPQEIKFLSANLNNDLFFIKNSEAEFCLKMSLDKNNSNLEKEFLILKDNWKRRIAPYPICHGSISGHFPVEYSIVGHVPAPNLYDYGIQTIVDSEDAIPYFFANLSRYNTSNTKKSLQEHLEYYLSFDILKIPDIDSEWVKNHERVKALIKNQVIFLQRTLREKVKNFVFSDKDFCHGDLSLSNILAFGEHLHAINYEKSYSGDWVFEFLCLKYELFFPNNIEKEYLDKIDGLLQTNFNGHNVNQLMEFVCYFNLLKLMVEYLTEVYILKCSRQNKILQCGIKLSKNYDHFYQLPDFDKNLKPIAEFFVESVI